MALLKHQFVRVSHLDLSPADWHLGKILAVGDSIPAYRYSAGESSIFLSFYRRILGEACAFFPLSLNLIIRNPLSTASLHN